MKALYVCLLMGVVCLPCMAAETFYDQQDVDGLIFETMFDGGMFDTVSWSHTIPGEAVGNITSASLSIDVTGVLEYDEFFSPADDHVSISLNGVYLGDLTGYTTVFSGTDLINALSVTNPTATAKIDFGWEGRFDPADAAKILTSTLAGEYVSAVPAPSAILLAGLGTTLVGFLRKRQA